MKYAILAGSAYLLFIGSMMNTKGMMSGMLFKVLPIGLSFVSAYAAFQLF